MGFFYHSSKGFLVIGIQNVRALAILICLFPISVGVGGIICSKAPLRAKNLLAKWKRSWFILYLLLSIVFNMAKSADPDETPCFAAYHLGLRYL